MGDKKHNKFNMMLRAFIPKNVSNRVFVNVYDFMRRCQRLGRKRYCLHLDENKLRFKEHEHRISVDGGYIEDQNNYTDMRYGKVTMKFSGCEIFATYNALHNLHGHSPIELSDMIEEYEKDGMVLAGKFGTAPRAIRDYLRKHDYDTLFTVRENEFDDIARSSDTLILTMYNDRNDIMHEVHTICISKENGMYTGHNVHCNGVVVGPYPTVTELIGHINGGRAKGISLIGIKKGL